MKYINKYDSVNEALTGGGAFSPNVSYVNGSSNGIVFTNIGIDKEIEFENNGGVISGKEKPAPIPLNFTANQAGSTVRLIKNGKGLFDRLLDRSLDTSYEYSEDGVNWNTYTIGDTITLTNVGDKVYFRGDNSTVSFFDSIHMQFEMSGSISASGNVMSILDKTMELTSVPSYSMYGLFNSCTSLTQAPELPVTNLAVGCYSCMFYGCTSLTTAPELPATTLAELCYASMFNNCTSLTELTVSANDISASNCLGHWLTDTALNTTGTLINKGSATYTPGNNIPSNWTVQTDTTNSTDNILVTCDVVDRRGNIITIFSENSAADVSDDKGVVSEEMELDLSHIEFTFENTSVLPTDNISLTIYWMYAGSEYNDTVQMSYDSENSKFYYDSGKQKATHDGPGIGVYPAVLTITNVTQNTVLREISFGHGEDNERPVIPTRS